MNTRKLGYLLLALTLAATAYGQGSSISGTVRDSAGVPQMGAAVEVLGSTAQASLRAFTDDHGRFSLKGLTAGTYQVKVSAPSFLPALRENVSLKSGASAIVNITLNTLFEALQMAPTRGRVPQDEDDWKWTLRSVANRPILRVLQDDEGPVLVTSSEGSPKALRAHVSFIAGGDGDGLASDGKIGTAFNVEHSIFGDDRVSFDGSLDARDSRATMLRAGYSHRFANGSRPEVTFTMRRFATAESRKRDAAIAALSLRASNTMALMDFVDFTYGSELQTVQFIGRAAALRPFAIMDVHLSPDTYVEYRYATARPEAGLSHDFASSAADLSNAGPRFSLEDGAPLLERAAHHEVSISKRLGQKGKNRFQAAFFDDHIRHLAPTGVGVVQGLDNGPLPDIYSNSFTYDAGNFGTQGLRLVAERDFLTNLRGTVAFSYGGVLDLAPGSVQIDDLSFRNVNRHAVTTKLSGRIPKSNTKWSTSYKWTSSSALTPVDAFDNSAAQANPYLDIFLRQPLPGNRWLPGQMEALVDVRNLLAQGYVPVIGQDGQTVYLVQSARSIRGGVAFTF